MTGRPKIQPMTKRVGNRLSCIENPLWLKVKLKRNGAVPEELVAIFRKIAQITDLAHALESARLIGQSPSSS